MKTIKPRQFFIVFLLICSVGSNVSGQFQNNIEQVNSKDTIKSLPLRNSDAEKLLENLKKLSETGKIMFGMANPTTLGYSSGPKNSDINNSDCKDITGSHPAFHESDFMWYSDRSFMKTDIEAMRKAYQRGAVCGYCWHNRGQNSDEFYAKKNGKFTKDKDLVKQIVASNNRKTNKALDWYLTKLDKEVIPVFNELEFPLIFRPFHEMNGDWFWWGTDNCTAKEYQKIFRLTVDYLRAQNVKNLLYAWSVNVDATFKFYPGDDYVDILGLDSYEPGISKWNPTRKFLKALQHLTDYAASHNKVAALTETGCRKENDQFRYVDQYPDYWTKYVLNPILSDSKAKRIVWIMSWYNSDWNNDLSGQYYIPYKGMNRPNGQQGIDDFLKFYNAPETLFENDLPDMYH